MRILMHACCGPCSLEPVRLLEEEGHDITLAYCNSNIHPQAEYTKRLDTLVIWAETTGHGVIDFPYDVEEWELEAGVFGTMRPDRCRACYRLRLEHVASLAKEGGYDAISTTLSVSPYQYTDIIESELKRAADKAGVKSVFKDFRPYYPEAITRSRELGMYRQKYCGCHFSIQEAQRDRTERQMARKAAQKARREARTAASIYCAAMEARGDKTC